MSDRFSGRNSLFSLKQIKILRSARQNKKVVVLNFQNEELNYANPDWIVWNMRRTK